MNKCKNCKYWLRNTKEFETKDFGECTCKKFQYEDIFREKKTTDDMLLYADYEGYSASFETGQNFGCIHFKEKDKDGNHR